MFLGTTRLNSSAAGGWFIDSRQMHDGAMTRISVEIGEGAETARGNTGQVCSVGVGRAGCVQLGFFGLLVEFSDLEELVGGHESRGQE